MPTSRLDQQRFVKIQNEVGELERLIDEMRLLSMEVESIARNMREILVQNDDHDEMLKEVEKQRSEMRALLTRLNDKMMNFFVMMSWSNRRGGMRFS